MGEELLDRRHSVSSQIRDPISLEWTDEKHSMYLSSIEASFVDQLYNSESRSNRLLDYHSRVKKQPKVSGSHNSNYTYGQDCWESVSFKKSKNQSEIGNDSRILSDNQWIKLFQTASIGRGQASLSSDGMDTVSKLVHSRHHRNEKKAATKKWLMTSCSHMPQDCVGSSTDFAEASDQNFVENEFEVGKTTDIVRRKRTKKCHEVQLKDQVVPMWAALEEPGGEQDVHGGP